MKPILDIINLSVEFPSPNGSFAALSNFSLTINEYQFVSLVGLSGCGKSTVLNTAAGYLNPSKGSIYFEGIEVKGPNKDRVVVFQEDAVFPWYTVEENIAYSLNLQYSINKSDRDNVINEYLNIVGLQDFKTFYPKDLSGGMKKRVDLARAYAANPKMLLMDEPFGALDTFTREHMQLQLLKLLSFKQKSVLFITHDISEAIFLSDKIVLMTPNPGKVDMSYEISFTRPRDTSLKKTIEFLDLQSEIESRMHEQEKYYGGNQV